MGEELSDECGFVCGLEEGRPGDKGVGTRPQAIQARFGSYPAVHFDAVMEILRIAPFAKSLDFPNHRADKVLPAKAWVHRHREHESNFTKQWTHTLCRGLGVESNPRDEAKPPDVPEGFKAWEIRLNVNRDALSTCVGKDIHVTMRLRQHEVGVEIQLRSFAKIMKGTRAKTEVWNEMSIHDVYVNPG